MNSILIDRHFMNQASRKTKMPLIMTTHLNKEDTMIGAVFISIIICIPCFSNGTLLINATLAGLSHGRPSPR